MIFEITDTGIGVHPKGWPRSRNALENGIETVDSEDRGYGIFNVNKRVELYYGKQYGLTIDSKYQQGTMVRTAPAL